MKNYIDIRIHHWSNLCIAQTSIMPGGTLSSVAAATAAFATAVAETGGTNAAPIRGTPARFCVGTNASAFSSGQPGGVPFSKFPLKEV